MKGELVLWFYQSPIGKMYIFKNKTGKYSLKINGIIYGSYNSAIAAADDVFTFTTGCYEWDVLNCTFEPPTDIYEWDTI